MIKTITGDLLNATEQYIIHQTNCVSDGGAAGIAFYLFNKYPYADCYSNRVNKSTPGTLDIRGDGESSRFIINLHGQYYPGGVRFQDSSLDGFKARKKYFYRGLIRISQIENLKSVAFPFKIGCGIAGGNWDHYLKMINNFAKYVKKHKDVETTIYQREGDF